MKIIGVCNHCSVFIQQPFYGTIGILTVYVSVERNTKREVDSADPAREVSTLTEGFIFTLYRNINSQYPVYYMV